MDDTAPPTKMDLSDGQQKALIVLRICSASLSFIGSCTIVCKILRDLAMNRSMTPYDRIMLCLATCDILSSITIDIQPFLVPSETGKTWAFGSKATCQAGGLLVQLSILWAYWYNCVLSYYFLLTVLSQLHRNNYVRAYEPWLHLPGIYFPITAIIGYSRGWYAVVELNGWCHITDHKLWWIFAGIPTIFEFFSMVINYSVIYKIVGKSLRFSEDVAGPTSVQDRIKGEATSLMFMYVGCFWFTTCPVGIIEFLGLYAKKVTAGKIYPLLVVNSILLPLQAFFNGFIYLKPFYTRFRAAYPNKSKWYVLKQAFLNSKAPRLHHRRVANHVTHGSDVLITDITLSSDRGMNPNEALFYPGVGQFSSFSDTASNNVAEGENNRRRSAEVEEAKEDVPDLGLNTEKPRKKISWLMTNDSDKGPVERKAKETEEQLSAADRDE